MAITILLHKGIMADVKRLMMTNKTLPTKLVNMNIKFNQMNCCRGIQTLTNNVLLNILSTRNVLKKSWDAKFYLRFICPINPSEDF